MSLFSPLRRRRQFAALSGLVLALALSGCQPSDPELVAIEYLRATHTAKSDSALSLLDIDSIVERVQEEIVLVNTDGDPDRFLADSVRTMIWGLYQETPRREGMAYDAPPADIDGDTARVAVTVTSPDGATERRTIYLRRTDSGWRVSGRSVDDLVSYVIQRLEERF
jgi:predicted ATPase